MTDTASAAPSEREQFEAWAKSHGTLLTKDKRGNYQYTPTSAMWKAWQAARAQPTPSAADQEPFGYFRAEPFGWTDCAETDEGAVALYEHPTPPAVVEPMTDERTGLRLLQSELVMPMIGPLLDAWEGLDNDTRSIIKDDSPSLARALSAINRAMEGGEPIPYEQLPTANKARMLIEELDSESERLTRFTNDSRDGLLSAAARMIEVLLKDVAPAHAAEADHGIGIKKGSPHD